jgi:hypothetical protein
VRVRYNSEPSWYGPLIEAALKKAPDALASGDLVTITVPIHLATKRGFERTVTITLDSDPESFDTDTSNRDPSRFGGRFRAAATALRDLGYSGAFRLESAGQTLSIQILKP